MEETSVTDDEKKIAFVIMPYGKKKGTDGGIINFDDIYRDVIEEPLKSLGFRPLLAKDIKQAGSIHLDMFRLITTAEVAVVDISELNPNVFYELGVRHAMRPCITILIKNRGTAVPFNINSERVIEYPDEDGGLERARADIKSFVESGLHSTSPDSPIFTLLQDARKDWKTERITRLEEHPYRLVSRPDKRVCVITGDIRERRDIDVWVNSENTNMQMSRFYDRSLSAIIRYEGAEKDENGEVVADTIAQELAASLGGRQSVTPGSVYVTGAGELTRTRGVKKIFHAATVCGVPGSGYQCMQDVEKCVTNALTRLDHPRLKPEGLRTIVFPMMGTGAGGTKVEEVAPRLIRTAVSYLLNDPGSVVETVYFSAWNYRDLEACLAALRTIREVEPLP
jgi:O-acetyl-ADP-ribose deacetylase (regulator of RNase III)